MKYLNDQIKMLYNINDNDYIKWCEKHNRAKSKKSNVAEFIRRFNAGTLTKNLKTGKLQIKRPGRRK